MVRQRGDILVKLNQLIAEMEGYDDINMPCFFVFFYFVRICLNST